MNEAGAMLWGRVTYEMMESYWPAVARGDTAAPPAIREWAVKLEAKPLRCGAVAMQYRRVNLR